MLDWLLSFDSEKLTLAFMGLGALIGSVWAGIKGVTSGKPTSSAVASAINLQAAVPAIWTRLSRGSGRTLPPSRGCWIDTIAA